MTAKKVRAFPGRYPDTLGDVPSLTAEEWIEGRNAEPLLDFDVQNLLDDIRKLRIIARGHEKRIKYLEERLASYEEDDGEDDEHP